MLYDVSYHCLDCDVTIDGESRDPQEAPHLYCPECGDELEFHVPKWD